MLQGNDSKDGIIMAHVLTEDNVAEAVIAEAIPMSEAKMIESFALAESVDENAVEFKLNELEIDPDGVKRRTLALRDNLVTGNTLDLRHDLVDPVAIRFRDADHEWTLLHHAAFVGCVSAIDIILSFFRQVHGQRDLWDYINETDDQGRTASDLALLAGHNDCISFLRHYFDDVLNDDDHADVKNCRSAHVSISKDDDEIKSLRSSSK